MWNDVLANFIKLKHRFIEDFGEDALWDYGGYKNCVSYWASKYEDFNEMFGILVINEWKDFVLFRYNLFDTDAQFWEKYNGMYRECRSLVIDKKNECIVLAPFRKFFNLNETEETSEKNIRARIANANRVEVSEKLDGSMQSARYYNGEIILAGSKALNPEQSFQLEIGYTMLTSDYEKMLMEHPQYTFIFEIICKEDQHVVVYEEDQRGLYLIGVRNVETGTNLSYADVIAVADNYNIPHTNVFDKTLDQMLSSLDEKKSNEAEGFVIDVDGYKVKLKYNDYVQIHHMLSKLVSTNIIIRAVENGSWDDICAKLPAAYRVDADIVANDVKSYIRKMTASVKKTYDECSALYKKSEDSVTDRKNFAIYVLQNHKQCANYLINLYEGKENNFIRNKAGRYLRYHEIKTNLAKLDN